GRIVPSIRVCPEGDLPGGWMKADPDLRIIISMRNHGLVMIFAQRRLGEKAEKRLRCRASKADFGAGRAGRLAEATSDEACRAAKVILLADQSVVRFKGSI